MLYERVETPVVRQRASTECFAVSLTIVLRYYGAAADREAVKAACDVSRDGADASNMLQVARDYGLEAEALRVSGIEQLTELAPPFVVFYGFNHGIVVEGVDEEHVYLNDPVRGREERSHAQFRDGFTGIVFTFAPGEDFEPDRRRWDGSVVRTLAVALSDHDVRWLVGTSLAAAVAGACVVGLFVALGGLVDRPEFPFHWGLAAGSAVGIAGGMGLRRWGHDWESSTQARRAVAATLRHAVQLPLSYLHQNGPQPGRLWTMMSRPLAHSLPRAATAYVFDGALLLTSGVALTQIHLGAAAGLGAALGGSVAVGLWGWRRHHTHNRDVQLRRASRLVPSLRRYSMMERYKATAPEQRHVYRTLKRRTAHNNRRQRLGTRRFGPEAALGGAVGLYVVLGLGIIAVGAGRGLLATGGMATAAGLVLLTGAVCYRCTSRFWDLQFEYECLRERRQMLDRAPAPLFTASDEEAAPDPEAPLLAASDVTVRFSRDGPPVVRDVTLRLAAGQHVVLVGPSGCGKSTLVEVLAGLRTPDAGTVEVGGASPAVMPPGDRTQWIGTAQSSAALWEASLRRNLTLGDSRPSEAALATAVRDAGLQPLVEAHPDGLDQLIGKGERSLSAGERRRIELARAVLHDPRVLLIDETTSELDDDGAAQIHQTLRRRADASLTVTHRMHRTSWFDRILVMDAGEIVQRGPHSELIAEEGPYTALRTSAASNSSSDSPA